MSSINPIPQACAVPYRVEDSGVEFCLITSRKSGRWGFPKGNIDSDQTLEQAALGEADEEAGLSGRIVLEQPLGEYIYKKIGREYSVVGLLMEVDNCRQDWKEAHQRERLWAAPADAERMLDRPHFAQLLQTALDQIQRSDKNSNG